MRTALQNDGMFALSTIVIEHNHGWSPTISRQFRSSKSIGTDVKMRLELNDQAGIPPSRSFKSLVVERGRFDKISFTEKDVRNFLEKTRKLRLREGDAKAMVRNFCRMQSKNVSFFYVMDLNEYHRIRNLCWVDARSRATYEYFGDVVTFDTIYLTNRYEMPFAPFVGVNHNGHSVFLGCGLLSNEDVETFVWLFEAWLECMGSCALKAIITDQCKAMGKAIEIVFPNARHRWDEFEAGWTEMMEKYELHDNEWLSGLYDERHRWVLVYVKDNFWAGMSTTQCSENVIAFSDGYVRF
ncbi:hypothetical protein L1049_017255 [Liquidambar formosana]|uniref:MULE transposase domain-containing protein n=1 Tax=Liquidambar formosana TaxID=63359 RepID=A0AAP0X833_LIQFO